MSIKKLNSQIQEFINELQEDSLEAMNEALRKKQFNEMSVAWIDNKTNKCCWVENPTGFNNKYFKYVNSFSYLKGDSMARISLLQPVYLEHKFMDGKKPWKLNTEEKKELVKTMNDSNVDFPDYTNWQITLAQYNMDNFGIARTDTINNSFDKAKYPKAFTIDTPMPNYMELS